MRIPPNSFDDADKALCRAHGDAVEQDHYSRMLVVEVVQEPEFRRSGRAVLPADLPLPPSYWDDLEHWLKTLSPAKPAKLSGDFAVLLTPSGVAICDSTGTGYVSAKQPEPAADVWHSEAPVVPGVYIASCNRDNGVMSYWDGKLWHVGSGSLRQVRSTPYRTGQNVEWLRLIEADPAKHPQAPQPTGSAS